MPESISAKLSAARQRWRILQAVSGIGTTLAIVAALALVSFWTDRAVALTTGGRTAWLIGLAAAGVLGLALFLLWPILRPVSDMTLASLVEQTYPALNERLLTTLSLAGAGGGGVSQAMVVQLAHETERLAAPLDFPRAVPSRDAQRPAFLAVGGGLLLIGHMALMPQAFSAWMHRILNPFSDIPVYAYTRVWVSPANTIIARGEDILLGVRTEGRAVDRATLRYRFGSGPWAETALARPAADHDARRFGFTLNDVQQDVTYYALAGDGQANAHTVRVEDRPVLLGVKMKLEYPAYTGRRAETIQATSANIVAPVGTHVEVDATANKPLESAICAHPGQPDARWQINGDRARGELTVLKDAACELRLKDTRGFRAQQPVQFSIRAQQDLVPQVKIEKPGADLERTPFGVVNLRVVASDDYGVHSLRLGWQVSGGSGGMELPGANGAKQVASGGRWGLGDLHLKGGDTVVYEALARDNDGVSGPHTGRSAKYQIHIVSPQEMKERLDSQKEQEREAIKQLVEHQKQAQKRLDQARQNRRPEQMRQAESAQIQVAAETADVAQRMRQTSQQMAENSLTTPAEQNKRQATEQELSQLSRQQMPQAAESVRKQDFALAAQQEQAIRERLESLSQETGPARNAAQLAQQAELLARQQQALAEQSANAEAKQDGKSPSQTSPAQRADMNRQAQAQAALNRQTAAMKEQLSQAAREAAEQGRQDAKALAEAAKQMQASGVQSKQSAAQQQLRSGKPGEASQQQNSAAQDLQNLADKLDQANSASADQLNQRAQKMDQLADRLQDTANAQRSAASSISRNPNNAQMQQLAGAEQRIGQQTREMSPDLRPYPQVRQQVQRAAQNIGSAEQQLNKQDSEQASSSAREAARQLLQASMDMRQAAQNMRAAAEARQEQQQVEQLAREQIAVRNQTHGADEARHGSSLTPEQDRQVGATADQQRKLTDRANNLGNAMGSNAMKMVAREVGAKMANATRNLDQRNTGADTQRRQTEAAQILQRVARSLSQEAKSQQQQAENAGQQNSGASDMAEAAEDLRLAREMQAQVRQETGGLDERRNRNPERRLTAEQQQELESIARMQRETEQITQSAAAQLRSAPEMSRSVTRASELMADVHDQMTRRRETGEPTQGQQDKAVSLLDQAIRQQQQAMRQQQQQQQQQMAQGQQQQQQQQQGQLRANRENKGFSPLAQQQPSQLHPFDPRGRGFNGLDPRTMQSMREGRQERVPAEYRDLVNQYYKALSSKGR